jgi:hypothetical protein
MTPAVQAWCKTALGALLVVLGLAALVAVAGLAFGGCTDNGAYRSPARGGPGPRPTTSSTVAAGRVSGLSLRADARTSPARAGGSSRIATGCRKQALRQAPAQIGPF